MTARQCPSATDPCRADVPRRATLGSMSRLRHLLAAREKQRIAVLRLLRGEPAGGASCLDDYFDRLSGRST